MVDCSKSVIYAELVMDENLPIRFGCVIQSREKRPGFLAWLVSGLLLCAAAWVSGYISLTLVVGLVGFALLVFLPALCGSLMGWFLGGVRNECKQFRQHLKFRKSLH